MCYGNAMYWISAVYRTNYAFDIGKYTNTLMLEAPSLPHLIALQWHPFHPIPTRPQPHFAAVSVQPHLDPRDRDATLATRLAATIPHLHLSRPVRPPLPAHIADPNSPNFTHPAQGTCDLHHCFASPEELPTRAGPAASVCAISLHDVLWPTSTANGVSGLIPLCSKVFQRCKQDCM